MIECSLCKELARLVFEQKTFVLCDDDGSGDVWCEADDSLFGLEAKANKQRLALAEKFPEFTEILEPSYVDGLYLYLLGIDGTYHNLGCFGQFTGGVE